MRISRRGESPMSTSETINESPIELRAHQSDAQRQGSAGRRKTIYPHDEGNRNSVRTAGQGRGGGDTVKRQAVPTAVLGLIENVALDPRADVQKLERMMAMYERL